MNNYANSETLKSDIPQKNSNQIKEICTANINSLSKKSGVRVGLIAFIIGIPFSILIFLWGNGMLRTNIDYNQVAQDIKPVAGLLGYLGPLIPIILISISVIAFFTSLYGSRQRV